MKHHNTNKQSKCFYLNTKYSVFLWTFLEQYWANITLIKAFCNVFIWKNFDYDKFWLQNATKNTILLEISFRYGMFDEFTLIWD